ncbi:ATP-binding protein [Acidovorax sp. FG27]|uniref:ATP-binding protein n=1 Tax=Acidovorax sp. FG27 TaxID=3133652 RepID=UPI0030E80FD0
MEVITGWSHRAFAMGDATCVGEARRHCAQAIADWGWPDEDAGRLSLVVTELGTNLLRHAVQGQLWIAFKPAWREVEVIALDKGPGMVDVQRSLTDGVSTGSGSPGTGLGAVRRMASDFDVHSSPQGTLVLARVRPEGVAQPALGVRLGAVRLAAPGETVCGDGWALALEGVPAGEGSLTARPRHDRLTLLVSDGLGHGPEAAAASDAALARFAQDPFAPLPALLQALDRGLGGTRGAALFLLRADPGEPLRFTGAGNILGRVMSGVYDKGMLTPHGTAGVQLRRAEPSTQELPAHAMMLVHTDGIASRWPASALAPLMPRDPALLAAALVWNQLRGRDDATVVVLKQEEPS